MYIQLSKINVSYELCGKNGPKGMKTKSPASRIGHESNKIGPAAHPLLLCTRGWSLGNLRHEKVGFTGVHTMCHIPKFTCSKQVSNTRSPWLARPRQMRLSWNLLGRLWYPLTSITISKLLSSSTAPIVSGTGMEVVHARVRGTEQVSQVFSHSKR